MSWKQRIPGVFEVTPGDEESQEDRNWAQAQIEGSIAISGIPLETQVTHRLSTWQDRDPSHKDWWSTIRGWLPEAISEPFLALIGTPGTGKTHLALALGWEWLERGKTVLYYHVTGLLNALRDGYRRSGETDYSHIIAFAQNCSLLILDDLGAEKETEWATEQLDYIIDYRYEHRKPLIVTSNLALDKLPPRVSDRLREGCIIHLRGESFRRSKRYKSDETDKP